MGVVYKGLHPRYGWVAVKCVRSSDRARAACLRNELAVAPPGGHRSVVRHYELIERVEETALVMELVTGVTLQHWFRRRRGPVRPTSVGSNIAVEVAHHPFALAGPPALPLQTKSICNLFLQIAAGLRHLHDHGCIHRDLKPENVMVDERRGRAVIVDLGIATTRERAATGDYLGGGTTGYLAPEVLRRSGAPTPSSDWYAFGLMLYEALTGTADQDYALRVLGGSPSCPRTRNPRIEPEISELCVALLQPSPGQRADSCDVQRVLSRYASAPTAL